MEPNQTQKAPSSLWKTILIRTLVGMGVLGALGFGIIYFVRSLIVNSGAYGLATNTILTSDVFKQDYGAMKFGRLPMGQIQTTLWWWQASLQISIDGDRADGVAVVDLNQSPNGVWDIVYLSNVIDWRTEKILINKQ